MIFNNKIFLRTTTKKIQCSSSTSYVDNVSRNKNDEDDANFERRSHDYRLLIEGVHYL